MGVIYSQGSASGKPIIDATSCLVCGDCAHVCPVGVLTQGANAIHIEPDAAFGCIACGHCTMVCPTDSIQVHGRRFQASDLVELPPEEAKASAEQLESLFQRRRSMRRFSPTDVPRHVIERIVSAAATAPMGIPPWDVGLVVFHGRESVRQLAWDTAETYKGLLKFMDHRVSMALFRLFSKKKTWQAMDTFILPLGRQLVQGKSEGKDLVLYDAPAAILFYASPHADAADPIIACTYAMLEAEALGLGTTMIGCVAPPITHRKDLLAKYGLPKGHEPKVVLIMGYPAVQFAKGVRRSFASVSWYRTGVRVLASKKRSASNSLRKEK